MLCREYLSNGGGELGSGNEKENENERERKRKKKIESMERDGEGVMRRKGEKAEEMARGGGRWGNITMGRKRRLFRLCKSRGSVNQSVIWMDGRMDG